MTAQNKTQKAFTLIELLIVIAVIGIIAIAVLAALNPVEQINRSRDTASVADAEQLQTAAERFYASQNYFPWMEQVATGPSDYALGFGLATAAADGSGNLILTKLSADTSELRQSYVQKISNTNSYNPLYIYHDDGANTSTYVCFLPQSDEFAQKAADRCVSTPDDYPADADVCVADAEKYCIP